MQTGNTQFWCTDLPVKLYHKGGGHIQWFKVPVTSQDPVWLDDWVTEKLVWHSFTQNPKHKKGNTLTG